MSSGPVSWLLIAAWKRGCGGGAATSGGAPFGTTSASSCASVKRSQAIVRFSSARAGSASSGVVSARLPGTSSVHDATVRSNPLTSASGAIGSAAFCNCNLAIVARRSCSTATQASPPTRSSLPSARRTTRFG